ncbi:putative ABC transport system permease protein [Kribbella sp. VKM Ac-2527]|uniref:Putative ABC transport system permease protein n=1 Tax=Kribbella caucasensis TaxID=2512215 RepID=A0A4R6K694_9ACTN|nr:ABC transporter permease [Kribbella sp. VKM Ac-2527]TDO44900.1 putative ABC transport system permease protein [Kribbella sp. VKM Ac-2527]
MIRLALTGLRFRAAAFLAIFIAVLLGSALLAAAGGLLETGLRLNASPQRLAAAPIVVTGRPAYQPPNGNGSVPYAERHSVDTALVSDLARTADVARVVPDVSFPAVVAPGKDTLLGHGWASAALAPYELMSGHAPGVGEVVVDRRLASSDVGSRVTVIVRGEPREFVLAGIASGAVETPSIFFNDVQAREFLARAGRVDAIGVFPARGVSAAELAERLELPAGVVALTGDDRGAAEFAGVATSLPLIIMSGVFGGMVAVVMALVVSATIGLSVRQRRRELALLRASGATPAQVKKLVVAETMLVSLLALVAGLLLGRTMGSWIFGLLTGSGIVPSALRFGQGVLPFAGAAVLTIAVVRVAVGVAAGRAARIRPIQALAEAAIPPVVVGRVRLIMGAVFAALTVGVGGSTVFMSPTNAAAIGGPAVLTGSIAVAVLGPVVIRAMLIPRITAWLERRGTSGVLAVINLRVRAVQFAAVLVPIMLATAIAVGNIYSTTTQQKAAVEAYTDNLAADVVVTSGTGGTPSGWIERVRSVEGVLAASELVRSKGWIEEPYDTSHTSDPWPLLGIDGPVYRGKVRAGSLDELTGDTVALPPGVAKQLKVGVGSEIGVRLGDDALVKVRVVALVEGPSGYESLLLPSELLAAHTTAGMADQILVRTSSSVDEVRSALASLPGATVGSRELLAAEYDAGLGVDAWIAYLLAGIAIAYAAIASINTIAVAVLDRRREFGLQRLTGSTRRQIGRMLLLESLVVAVFGLVLGLVAACFSIFPIAIATRGWPLPSGPLWILPTWIAVVLLLVLPTTALTARLAMRPRPMDAITT